MHRTPSVLASSAMTLVLAVLGGALTACDASSQPTGLPAPVAPSASDSTAGPDASPGTTPGSTRSPDRSASASTTDRTDAPEETATDDAPASPSEPTSVPTFGGTASDAPAASGAPTNYPEAQARVSALRGGNARDLRRFSTPGDRIYCVLADPVLGTACELRSGAITDPEVCGGGVADAVGRIELIGAGAVPQCNTDTIREPGAPTVRPAALVGRGGVLCAVEEIGVTCVREARGTGSSSRRAATPPSAERVPAAA
ncbi:hypothetical protein [Nocardioides sambongensis]|uniref:hypothetical protein n=1 Tax=Nocardioides sambongensis TaxID=2589074 RepID=UPI001128444C|nr:hypothetical protein [Nocardioides sambongensis]